MRSDSISNGRFGDGATVTMEQFDGKFAVLLLVRPVFYTRIIYTRMILESLPFKQPVDLECSATTISKQGALFEGDKQAWLTVFGAFFSMFAAWGQVNAFGTFQDWYSENQLHELSPSTISWIGSLQLCVLFLAVRFVRSCPDAL